MGDGEGKAARGVGVDFLVVPRPSSLSSSPWKREAAEKSAVSMSGPLLLRECLSVCFFCLFFGGRSLEYSRVPTLIGRATKNCRY